MIMNTEKANMRMPVVTATATEMQNSFGKYADMVSKGQVIIVTKNGKELGRFIPAEFHMGFLTDKLRGIIKESAKGDFDYDEMKAEELDRKYEIDD